MGRLTKEREAEIRDRTDDIEFMMSMNGDDAAEMADWYVEDAPDLLAALDEARAQLAAAREREETP